ALGAGAASPSGTAGALTTCDAGGAYRDRYLRAWGPGALGGLRVGLYQHSSVARDLLGEILAGLGAEVILLARSETFIPVDTEAVDPETRALLRDWCAEHRLDALVSTDGDADRPMLVCETGALIPGDGLGAMTARALGADTVVTPVNSNTQADAMGFDRVIRTRIGSPFVIAGMEEAGGRVVGYEANGGTLLGFDAEGPAGPLPRLATRDAVLPILAPLAAA
ncbi:phosphomannomutase, partial [Litorisediminicola beolgyonensis]